MEEAMYYELNHVQVDKVRRLIQFSHAFRLRVLFELGRDAVDLPYTAIRDLAERKIKLEEARRDQAHWTYSSGRLTGLIQVHAAADALANENSHELHTA